MTHTEFIKQLKTLPPDYETYRKAGYNDESIKADIARNTAHLRESFGRDSTDNPVLALIRQFDMGTIEIGMITFNQEVENRGNFAIFGKFEVDDLAISSITKEIVMLEEDTERITMYCAGSGASFLEALIFIGKFLIKRALDFSLFEDEKANLDVAAQTSDIAGGEKYFNFYRMMLGV